MLNKWVSHPKYGVGFVQNYYPGDYECCVRFKTEQLWLPTDNLTVLPDSDQKGWSGWE